MKAEIVVNKNYKIGEIDKRIYGSFIEHLGRAVYGGIYEPGHETADEMGFRNDVIDLIKELEVPIVRYPGGNFVSGYNWEDGIGDKAKRPKKLELAWESTETNEVGVDEFQGWAKRADTDVMMAVNLGTRGCDEARNLLEYCNLDTDTYYANLRKKNGFEEPFHIKTWCLGNEMDGDWQIGHKTAEEYARAATETAKLMKLVDPNIELVACGSSYYEMPTFGKWELTVLEEAYDYVDYVSMHQYYSNYDDDTAAFIGKSEHMNQYIKSVVALCDAVKAKKHQKKNINLSFDEWNVWYHSNGTKVEKWMTAPPILEDVYNFEDALLVGGMLMTLQNNCDRVKMACMAQLVNAIAPIMTENNGKAWRQTIYYPYKYASVYGRGETMNPVVKCDYYSASYAEKIPYLGTAVVHNEEKREIVVYALNRSLVEDMKVTLAFENFGGCTPIEHVELYSDDFKAVNTAQEEQVSPAQVEVQAVKSYMHEVNLKRHSWNMIRFAYE